MKIRFHYGSIWLKFGITRRYLVKAFHVEFKEIMFNDLRAETRSERDRHEVLFSFISTVCITNTGIRQRNNKNGVSINQCFID